MNLNSKRLSYGSLAVVCLLAVFASPPLWAISVTITQPSNNSTFDVGETITFSATTDGGAPSWDFCDGGTDSGFTVTKSFGSSWPSFSCAVTARLVTATSTVNLTIQSTATPELNISAASANKNEGNSGQTNFTFTVSRSPTSGSSSASWSVSGTGGSPASGSDFIGGAYPSGTVNFPGGDGSETITVPVAGDTTVENNETFRVTLSSPSNATIGTSTANGTIQNDDTGPPVLSISASSANKNEGDSGTTSFTFNVNRSGDTSGTSTVSWGVSGNGTNQANGADFVGGSFPSGGLTFTSGQTSKQVSVPVQGDTVVETDDGFRVTLSGASGASIGTSSATGTIQNDDTGPPSLSIGATSANKNEGTGGTTNFTFTVTRAGDTSGSSSANWNVSGIGANPANGSDFVGGSFPGGTVNFTSGDPSETITVPVVADSTSEENETFRVTLSGASGATIGTATADGTILNDDVGNPGTVEFVSSGSSVPAEGNSGGAFDFPIQVRRTGGSDGIVSVDCRFQVTGVGAGHATAGGVDFFAPTRTLTWPDGEMGVRDCDAPIVPDTDVEGNETFQAYLTNPVGSPAPAIGSPSEHIVTIVDDDTPGTLGWQSANVQIPEGDGSAVTNVLMVTRTGGSAGAVSVRCSTTGGTATAGVDYQTVSNLQLNWGDQDTDPKPCPITILGEHEEEASQTIVVTLSNFVGAASGVTQSILTLTNDDDAGLVKFESAGFSVTEGGTAQIQLRRLANAIPNEYSGSVQARCNFAADTATEGEDFDQPVPVETVTWSNGQFGLRTCELPITQDTDVEPDETVDLTFTLLTGEANPTSPVSATLTIDDDEDPGDFRFASASSQVYENASTVSIPVQRINGSDGPASVDCSIIGGTAIADVDYVDQAPQTLNWADGDSDPKNCTLTINDDSAGDAEDADVTVQLGLDMEEPAGIASVVSPSQHLLTIQNDDVAARGFETGCVDEWSNRQGYSCAYTAGVPVQVEEGAMGFEVQVGRLGDLSQAAMVTCDLEYEMPGGPGFADAMDVETWVPAGPVGWMVGDDGAVTCGTLTVNSDDGPEGLEDLTLVVDPEPGSDIIGTRSVLTLLDRDVQFVLTRTAPVGADLPENTEMGDPVTVTYQVTRLGDLETSFPSLGYQVSEPDAGNPAEGADFSGGVLPSESIDGVPSGCEPGAYDCFSFDLANDSIVEPAEAFRVRVVEMLPPRARRLFDEGSITETIAVDSNDMAVDDTATLTEDDPATSLDVMGNDPVESGTVITSVTQPANGTVANGGSDLTYEPDPDYCNDGSPTDDFTYTLNASTTATVAVTVDCVNDAPDAVNDSATVTEDAIATTIDVLANDSDVEMDSFSITSVTQPTNGTVVNGGSDLTYEPDPDYCNDGSSTDDFTYTLTPGGDTATVAVTVDCVNDAPNAVNDSATVTEDAIATTIDVLANDTDAEMDSFSITSVTQPTNGTVVNGGSDLTYEPDPDYCNDGSPTDDFTYTLTPGGATATVAVTVNCVNDPPDAVNDSPTVLENAAATTIDVLANDTDAEMDSFSITSVTQPTNGTVVNGGSDLTYEPDPDYCNDGSPTDDFSYTLTPGGDTATVSVTVTCTYLVSGTVASLSGGAKVDIEILQDMASVEVLTNVNPGNPFAFSPLPAGSYTITATRGMSSCTVTPSSVTLPGDVSGVLVDGC